MTKQKCRVCKKIRPIEKFGRRYKDKEQRFTICQYCNYEIYGKRWNKKHITPETRRGKKLRNRYGMTPDDHDRLWKLQEGKCAICGSDYDLVIDHDHATNVVRGLLCRPCNMGLGAFRDSLHLLENAKEYIFSAPIFDFRKAT